jgi:hypothetical protein
MANPANTGTYLFGFGAGANRSNKEDWFNAITMLSPAEQPFLAAAPRDPIGNELPYWNRDSLRAVITATGAAPSANHAVEGDDFSFASYGSVTGRVRMQNSTQIFREDIAVPDTQQTIAQNGLAPGVSDEYEYQATKAAKEIMNDIEARVFIETPSVAGSASGASGVARLMAGLAGTGNWGAIPNSAINSGITTAFVNNLHELLWIEGARPDTLYVSPGVKADFSAAAQVSATSRVHNIAASDYRVITVVNVFDGDYGMLRVVPSRQIRQSALTADAYKAWLVERQRARLGILRPLKHTPLPKNGDATRGFVLTELTLKLMHPSAVGYLDGVTT